MSQLRRKDLAAAVRWSDLIDEFDCWRDAGRVATLWWRDDDAAGPSERLDRLLSISGDIPIALAVIPAGADSRLAAWLAHPLRSRQTARLLVLQHGWRHQNHAVDGKKSEFPRERSRPAVACDLATGRMRLVTLFEARALPVLAPPWNRFKRALAARLPAAGLHGLSAYGPRAAAEAAPGIRQVNTHIDIIDWRGTRGFAGEDAVLRDAVEHLAARRSGAADAAEPTGWLTHHALHDAAAHAFLERLFERTRSLGARWLHPGALFPSRP